jgi:mannose-6-phosphate isomerase
VFRLDNPIQPYAWGSFTAIPALLGQPPAAAPQAELWLGAHPSAPSRLEGSASTLLELISRAPAQHLGERSCARFGPTLPFLLKVLAAAQPLSLQAHPSLDQAQAGFAREEAAKVPRHAAHRNYRDPNHKPELICALTPFHALCGFRAHAGSVALFEGLGLDVAVLRRSLREYFEWAMTLPEAARLTLSQQVVRACTERPVPGFEAECRWAQRLGAQYAGDIGVVGALLLNLITLAPGQALWLPAGKLHAYLEGVGVELMASSDNVLRGGLTPKHVDVPELMRVLDFSEGPVPVLEPKGPIAIYETASPDFELTRLTLAAGQPITLEQRGADLLLVTEGTLSLTSGQGQTLTLQRGASAFAGAAEGPLVLAGAGTAFRATVGR